MIKYCIEQPASSVRTRRDVKIHEVGWEKLLLTGTEVLYKWMTVIAVSV